MTGYSLGFFGQDDWKVTRRLTLNLGLRLVHDTPYTDATGDFGVAAWTPAWYNADVAAGVTNLPGMRWHGLDLLGGGIHSDPNVPLSGHTLDALFYSPRFGLAYDVFGTGKTVARGGFGVYYYRDGIGGSAGTNQAQGGTSCQTTGNLSNSYLSQITSATITCANSSNGVTGGNANDPNDHVEPRSWTYTFTISQQTFGKTALEVSYMGSQTTDLNNPVTLTSAVFDAFEGATACGGSLTLTNPTIAPTKAATITVKPGRTPGFCHYTVTGDDGASTQREGGWIVVGKPAATLTQTGNNQSGSVGTVLSQPLTVTLTPASSGASASGAGILFSTSAGTLSVGTTVGSSVIAPTNSSGIASVTLTLPSTKGTVTVTTQDQFALGGASVTFAETAN